MIDKILELMNENPIMPTKLQVLLAEMNAVDIAEAFLHLPRERIIQIFRLLPKDMAAEVFA
jgi:magnesium transporter